MTKFKQQIINISKAALALPWGIKSCLFNPELRRLAFFPWVLGLFAYFLTLIACYFIHPHLVAVYGVWSPGFISSLVYAFVWLGAGLLLLGAAVATSTVLVLIFSASVQSNIARITFGLVGVPTAETSASIVSSIGTEAIKLVFLTPFLLISLLLGLMPLLIPLAVVLTAWLLAYQFVDIALELKNFSLKQRISFCIQHAPTIATYGLSLVIFWSVPFLGIFLAPAAVSGATWLINELEILA